MNKHLFLNIQEHKSAGAFSPHFYALVKDGSYFKIKTFGQKTLLNKLQLTNCVYDDNIKWIPVDSINDAELKFLEYLNTNCKIDCVDDLWNIEGDYYLKLGIQKHEFLSCIIRRAAVIYANKNKRGYLNVCVADVDLFSGDKTVTDNIISWSGKNVQIVDFKSSYVYIGYNGKNRVDGCAFVTNDSENQLWLAIMTTFIDNYWCVIKV